MESFCISQILNGSNEFLSAYQKALCFSALSKLFYSTRKASHLIGRFSFTSVKKMLYVKVYAAFGIVFFSVLYF